MTTEVLRNMIHAEPGRLIRSALRGARRGSLPSGPLRGGVWEEVIFGAPSDVTLVCLSATVANADSWRHGSEVRGATGMVIESHRPVELKNLFVVGDRSAERLHLLPTFVDGRPNREAIRLDSLMARPGSGRRGGVATVPGGGGGAGPGPVAPRASAAVPAAQGRGGGPPRRRRAATGHLLRVLTCRM